MPAYLGLALAGGVIISIGTVYLLATVVLPALEELLEERQERRRMEQPARSSSTPLSDHLHTFQDDNAYGVHSSANPGVSSIGLRRRKKVSVDLEPNGYRRRDLDTDSKGLENRGDTSALLDAPLLQSTFPDEIGSDLSPNFTLNDANHSSSSSLSRESSRSSRETPFLLSPNLVAFPDSPSHGHGFPSSGSDRSNLDTEQSPFTLISDTSSPSTPEERDSQPFEGNQGYVSDWSYLSNSTKRTKDMTSSNEASFISYQNPATVEQECGSSDGFDIVSSMTDSDISHHSQASGFKSGSLADGWDPLVNPFSP